MTYINGFTAIALVEFAVRNARPNECGESDRWVAVQDVFGFGMASSIEMCRRFGLDPFEKVPGPTCLSCNP